MCGFFEGGFLRFVLEVLMLGSLADFGSPFMINLRVYVM